MFGSSIKRKAAGFLAAVMAMSTLNSFPINIAAEEEAENAPAVYQTLEAESENTEAVLLDDEPDVPLPESVYDVSFMGAVEYAGDESWKSVTRPASFDSSVMELYAVMADGSEIKLDLQSTNFSGNIYMQYVDGDDGEGTFTISKAPSKLDDADVISYRLFIPRSAYYSEANVGIAAGGKAVLTLKSITSELTVTKKVPGGVSANTGFPVNITLSTGSGFVTVNKTLTVAADSFKLFYRDITDAAESEITVSGFLNNDGTPKKQR